MDRIDWCIFIVAVAAIPVSFWLNVRWWRRSRRGDQPQDWQSLAMFTLGLVCMIAIVVYYLVKFIIPGKT